jgi:hypothetical protein
MKSIVNQYRDLKEGKMSQANFMRNVRMTLPHYVTNTTSYNDTIKILRNKGILTENIIKQLEKGIEVEKEHTKDEVKAAKIAIDHLKEDPKYYTKLTKAGLEESHDANTQWIERFIDILGAKGIDVPEGFQLEDYDGMTPQQAADKIESELMNDSNDDYPWDAQDNSDDSYPTDYGDPEADFNDGEFWEAKDGGDDDAETLAMIDKIAAEKAGEEEVMGQYDESLNEAKSWTNTSGKEMYAQFRELDNLNAQEVLIGIDFEMEENHELSKEEAAKIVARKLKQNPNFYTAHALAGKEMKEIPTIGKLIPGSDQMRPLKNEADLIDKDNGLKPVKGVEKIKASANKATKETNKPTETISLMSLVAKTSKGVTKMVATGEKMKVVKENLEDQGRKLSKKIADLGLNAEKWDAMSHNEKLNAIDKNRFIDPSERMKAVKMTWSELTNYFDGVRQGFIFPTEPKKKGVDLGKYNLKDLTEIVREVLAEMESDDEVNTDTMLGLGETMDGRDNVTDVAGHQLDELSSQEQSIVNDIIGTLNEGMFSDMLDKVKNYAKKGLLTVAIVATLLGGTMLTTNQKQDVIDVVKTEMPASQNTDLKYQTDAWSAYTTYKYNKEKIDQLAQQDPEVADLVSTLTYRDFQKRSPNEQISIGKDYQNAINKIDSLK